MVKSNGITRVTCFVKVTKSLVSARLLPCYLPPFREVASNKVIFGGVA